MIKSFIEFDNDSSAAATLLPVAVVREDDPSFDGVPVVSSLVVGVPSTPHSLVSTTFGSNSSSSSNNHNINHNYNTNIEHQPPFEGTAGDHGGDFHETATLLYTARPEPSPSTPHPSPRRCHTAPWDERINWSKPSKCRRRQRFRRSNSVGGGGGTTTVGTRSHDDSSTTTSDSSVSTHLLQLPQSQLIRPAAVIRRNISSSSSTSFSSSSTLSLSDYSVGDPHELPLLPSDHDPRPDDMEESRNPIFFSPRRRLNSLVHTTTSHNDRVVGTLDAPLALVPVAVVSVPTGTDHHEIAHTSCGGTPEEVGNRDSISTSRKWCWFGTLFHPPPPRNSANQRRNLLLLFLIATYTTFGLASPNVPKTASAYLTNSYQGNVILVDDAAAAAVAIVPPLPDRSNLHDRSFLVDDTDMNRAAVESSAVTVVYEEADGRTSQQLQQLRGRSSSHGADSNQKNALPNNAPIVHGHLSFARGGGGNANNNHLPNPPLLVYRRREVNDFYHQPALLQEENTAMKSWYLNCFVLLIIAVYYVVRDHKKVLSSCKNGTTSDDSMVHNNNNTHHL